MYEIRGTKEAEGEEIDTRTAMNLQYGTKLSFLYVPLEPKNKGKHISTCNDGYPN